MMEIMGFTPYREAIIEALERGYEGSLGDVANVIWHAHLKSRPILTCGNGGSAATAIHFASDLRSLGIEAWDLLSPSKLTQIGNDEDTIEGIFESQIEVVEKRNPIVVLFSCSGTSFNVETCRSLFDTIFFTSTMNELWPKPYWSKKADLIAKVKSDDYEIIEDIHLMMCHALKKMISYRLAGETPETPKELETE